MGWFYENLFHSGPIYPGYAENREHYTASTFYIQTALVFLSKTV